MQVCIRISFLFYFLKEVQNAAKAHIALIRDSCTQKFTNAIQDNEHL
jgi:hypothetical protein